MMGKRDLGSGSVLETIPYPHRKTGRNMETEEEQQAQPEPQEVLTKVVAAVDPKEKKKATEILVSRTVISEKLIRDAVVEDFDGAEGGYVK